MDEQMKELCDMCNVNFYDLHKKLDIKKGEDVVISWEEAVVLICALETAGGV